MRSNNNQRCAKREIVHRGKQQCMANNLGQGVNNKLVLTDGGILRYDMRGSLTVITTATTTVSRCLSLRSFLSAVSMSATTAASVRRCLSLGSCLSSVSVSTATTTAV